MGKDESAARAWQRHARVSTAPYTSGVALHEELARGFSRIELDKAITGGSSTTRQSSPVDEGSSSSFITVIPRQPRPSTPARASGPTSQSGVLSRFALLKSARLSTLRSMPPPAIPAERLQLSHNDGDVDMDNHSELTPALPLDFSNDRLPPSTKEEDNACLAMRRQFREPSPALGTGVKKLPFPWEAGFVPRMHRNTEIQATWREWVDSVDHYQLPRKVEPEHRPAFWAYVEWFNLLEFKWLKHGQLGVNFLVKVNGKKRLAKGRTAYMKAFGKHKPHWISATQLWSRYESQFRDFVPLLRIAVPTADSRL